MAAAGAHIRDLQAGDYAAVLDIYNHYITHSPVTFDTEPFNMAQRVPWFAQFEQPPYRCLVAEQDGQVCGYACALRFKEKAAYGTSVEVSIYLSPDNLARGIGTLLYEVLFEYLNRTDFHRAYAGVTLPNDASVALHRKLGFEQVGLYTEVGFKFDQYWDVAWFEKDLTC